MDTRPSTMPSISIWSSQRTVWARSTPETWLICRAVMGVGQLASTAVKILLGSVIARGIGFLPSVCSCTGHTTHTHCVCVVLGHGPHSAGPGRTETVTLLEHPPPDTGESVHPEPFILVPYIDGMLHNETVESVRASGYPYALHARSEEHTSE